MAAFLVLEDYAPLAHTLERVLKEIGEVWRAASVAEAQTLLKKDEWSALFIDMLLPDGNGLDVLASARARGCTSPALIFSAVYEPEAINRAFDLGARYLVKPSALELIVAFARDAAERLPTARWAQSWAKRYDLTVAETNILAECAAGLSRDELIRERGIKRRTFQKHVTNLLRKTGDRSLLAACNRLLREQIH